MQRNPLREALQSRRFSHVVEIVASRISREARLLEVASQLATTPGVVAGSITSYAGGAPGQDPLRVGTAARARGLAANIHVTCVSKDRQELRQYLETIAGLGLENVFALTGDYPQDATPVFDLDSVDLSRPNVHRHPYGWPLAWTRSYGSGRIFYEALGHEVAVWRAPWFQQMLRNAALWVLRRVP